MRIPLEQLATLWFSSALQDQVQEVGETIHQGFL